MQLTHSPLGTIHVLAAVAALVFGAAVLLTRKGGRLHRLLGYGYVGTMLTTNLTALTIFQLTGSVGPFHLAAVFSGATVVAGLIPVLTRRPRSRWLAFHYAFMAWSYVGLVAAAVSEAAVRLPNAPFWGAVLLGSLTVFVLGGIAIARARPRVP